MYGIVGFLKLKILIRVKWYLFWPVQAAITNNTNGAAYKQQEFISHTSGGWQSEIRVPVPSDEGLLGC